MDTHADDLNPLERRLASCVPATAGLDADAMLFAAGRAAVRPGTSRIAWALTGALSVLAVVLGFWLHAERSECLSLAAQLRHAPAPAPSPLPAPPDGPPTADQPSPSGLLAAHPLPERGLDDWPEPAPGGAVAPSPVTADLPVLRVGRPDQLPDL